MKTKILFSILLWSGCALALEEASAVESPAVKLEIESDPSELTSNSAEGWQFVPGEEEVLAQNKKRVRKKKTGPSTPGASGAGRPQDAELVEALSLVRKQDYVQASMRLFRLSVNPRFRDKRNQIRYLLGLTLYQMKLNQVSTFQFISVAKEGNSEYLRNSLEKLSLAADYLGDDTVLNYAISKVAVEQFPKVHRDMLFFRIGEYQMRTGQFAQATESFARVSEDSSYFAKAKYNQALAFAEDKNVARAVAAFDTLIGSRGNAPVTDPSKVAAQLGKARALYQGRKWSEAIEAYRAVPRDSALWHDTLLESSWAMLRSGKFRSALSNFQSLHSAYYNDTYLPESLMLRAITYFYICRYDEMDKVIQLFEKVYRPVYDDIKKFVAQEKAPDVYYREVAKIVREYQRKGRVDKPTQYGIPVIVARKIYEEGDFQKTFKYLQKLLEENRTIKTLPVEWQRSAIGKYARKVVANRIGRARAKAGRIIQAHLNTVQEELFDLFEQQGFVRFEMTKAKKEILKSKIAGAALTDVQIEEDSDRDFYIQNGYDYWPFRGEYWLDEIGNYHYLGTQACQ